MLQQKIVRAPQNFPDISSEIQGRGCTDLQLVCQDGTVSSHQFLLSMHSDLLKSLFGEQMIPVNDAEWMPGDSGMGVKPFIKQTFRKRDLIHLLLPEYQCREVQMLLQLLCRGETSKMNKILDVYKDGKYKLFHLLKDLGINDSKGGFNKTMLEKIEIADEGGEPAVSQSLVNVTNKVDNPRNVTSSITHPPRNATSSVSLHPQNATSSITHHPPRNATSAVSLHPPNATSAVSLHPQNATSSIIHHPRNATSAVTLHPPNATRAVSLHPPNATSAVSLHPPNTTSAVTLHPPNATSADSPQPPNATSAVSPHPPNATSSVNLCPPNAMSSVSHRPQNDTSSVSLHPPNTTSSVSPHHTSSVGPLDINSALQNSPARGIGSSSALQDDTNSVQKSCIKGGPVTQSLTAAGTPLNKEPLMCGLVQKEFSDINLVKEFVGPFCSGTATVATLERNPGLETPVVESEHCDLPLKEASLHVPEISFLSARDTITEMQAPVHTVEDTDPTDLDDVHIIKEDTDAPSLDDVHIIKDTHPAKQDTSIAEAVPSEKDTISQKQDTLIQATDSRPPSSDDVHILKDTHPTKQDTLEPSPSTIPPEPDVSLRLEDTNLPRTDASLLSVGHTINQKQDLLNSAKKVHPPISDEVHILKDTHPSKQNALHSLQCIIPERHNVPDLVGDTSTIEHCASNPAVKTPSPKQDAVHSIQGTSSVEDVEDAMDDISSLTEDDSHVIQDIDTSTDDFYGFSDQNTRSPEGTTQTGNDMHPPSEDDFTNHDDDHSSNDFQQDCNEDNTDLTQDSLHIETDSHSPLQTSPPTEESYPPSEDSLHIETDSRSPLQKCPPTEELYHPSEDSLNIATDCHSPLQKSPSTEESYHPSEDSLHIETDSRSPLQTSPPTEESYHPSEDSLNIATDCHSHLQKSPSTEESYHPSEDSLHIETEAHSPLQKSSPTEESYHPSEVSPSTGQGYFEDNSPPTSSRSRHTRSTPSKVVTDPYKNVVRGFSKRKAYNQTIPVEPYNPHNDEKLKEECLNKNRIMVVKLTNLTKVNKVFGIWRQEDIELLGNKVDDKKTDEEVTEMISEDDKNEDEPSSPTSRTLTRDQNSSPLNKIRDHDRLKGNGLERLDIEEEDIHMSYSLNNGRFDEVELDNISEKLQYSKNDEESQEIKKIHSDKRKPTPKKRQRMSSGEGPKSKKRKVESPQQVEQILKCPLEGCSHEESLDTSSHPVEYFVVKHFISTHITALYKDIDRQTMYQCDVSGCTYRNRSKTSFLAHGALEHLDLVRRVNNSRKTCNDEESVVYDHMQVQLQTLWNEWEQQLAKETDENNENNGCESTAKYGKDASEVVGISVIEPKQHEENPKRVKSSEKSPRKKVVDKITDDKDGVKLLKKARKATGVTNVGQSVETEEGDTHTKPNEVVKVLKKSSYSRGHEKMVKKANNDSEYSRIFGEPAQLVPKATSKSKKNVVSLSPQSNKETKMKASSSVEVSAIEPSLEEFSYKCKSCPYIYKNDKELIHHVVKTHSDDYEKIAQLECGEKYYECTAQCARKFKNKDYGQHLYKDHGILYNPESNLGESSKCDELVECPEPCTKTFKTKDSKARYSQHLFKDHAKITILFIENIKNWNAEGPLSKLRFCKLDEKLPAGESYFENQFSGILSQDLKKKSNRTSIFRTRVLQTPMEENTETRSEKLSYDKALIEQKKKCGIESSPNCSQPIQKRSAPVVTKHPIENSLESDDEVHIIEIDEDYTKSRQSVTYSTEKRPKRMQKIKSKESTKTVPGKKNNNQNKIEEITISDCDDETKSDKVPEVESVELNSCQFCECPFGTDDYSASIHIFEEHLQEMDEMWKDLFVHEQEGNCCKLCESIEVLPTIKEMKIHIFNDHSNEFVRKASSMGNFSSKTLELLKTKIPLELSKSCEEPNMGEQVVKDVSDILSLSNSDPDKNAEKYVNEEGIPENNENDESNQVSNDQEVNSDVHNELNISNTPEDECRDVKSNNLNKEERSKECIQEKRKINNVKADFNMEDKQIKVDLVQKRLTRSSADREEQLSSNMNLHENEKNRSLLSPVSSDEDINSELIYCASSFTSLDCPFKTKKAKELINHMIEERGTRERIRREKKEEIPCPACSYRFTNWKQLEDHVREIHTREDQISRNPSTIKVERKSKDKERKSRDRERKSRDKEKSDDFLRNPRDLDEDDKIQRMLKESNEEDESFRVNQSTLMREQHVMSADQYYKVEDRKNMEIRKQQHNKNEDRKNIEFRDQHMMSDEQYYKNEERRGMEARRRSRCDQPMNGVVSHQQRRPNWVQSRNENANWDDNFSSKCNQNLNHSRFQYGEPFNNETYPGTSSGQYFPVSRDQHHRHWGNRGKRGFNEKFHQNDYSDDQRTGRYNERMRGNGKRDFEHRQPRCSSTDSGNVKNPRRNSDGEYDRMHGKGGRRSSFSSPGSYLTCPECRSTFTEIAKLEEHTQNCVRSTRN